MKYIRIITSLLLLSLLSSCVDFEELNKNPNNPPTSDPEYIFNYVMKEGAGEFGSGIYSTYNINYVQRWVMHTAAVYGNSTMPPYSLFDQYRIQNLWKYFYASILMNCNVVEELTATDTLDINKHAAAQIWKIYNFHKVTDLWGDVPYFDAWEFMDNISLEAMKPKYDSQEDIYNDMLKILGEAVQSFDDSKVFFENDILYDGDLDMWRRFGNSLRLRLAIRAGDQSLVSQIITDNLLISSNDESAIYTYLDNKDWWSPYFELDENSQNPSNPDLTGTSVPKISDLMVRKFKDNNDPRLEIFAQPIEIDNVTYTGVPNLMNSTLKENQAMGIGVVSTSYIGPYFSKNSELAKQLISYSEVCFLRAEAAHRNWTSDIAADWYEEGVRSSMEFYEVDTANINAFLMNEAAFDNSLEQIMTQKWIALFLDGWEAFTEYRRTGFPQLEKWELELDGIKIKKATIVDVPREYVPGRIPYPDDEKDYNRENYENAVNNLGEDTYYQQLWFSKQFGTINYQ